MVSASGPHSVAAEVESFYPAELEDKKAFFLSEANKSWGARNMLKLNGFECGEENKEFKTAIEYLVRIDERLEKKQLAV